MAEKQLPARPDLEQYRKQAKELKRACHEGDGAALERVRKHRPGWRDADLAQMTRVALADAQLTIAREHGFESWPKFAAEIERLRIARAVEEVDDPVAAFLRAALIPREGWHASGTLAEANAILARYPQVARANIHTAAILAEEEAVRGFLARDAANATVPGGPYGWDALTHLCFSRYVRLDSSRSDALVRTARALLEAGASANAAWWETIDKDTTPRQVPEHVLYGAAGIAKHAGLTRVLLEYGADPNDEETPYHAPESYDNTVVEILLASGKLSERSKAWILVRKADWHDIAGMKMALDYGADPNLVPQWGRSAMQHAVERDNRVAILRLLLERGGDPLLPNAVDGRTAAQVAARHGRGDFLRALDEMGVDPKFAGVDRLIAACARGDGAAAAAIAREEPELRAELLAQGGELLGAFAGVGNPDGVRCLLDLGVAADARYPGDAYFDRAKDSTALHVAAWHGDPETMRLLIERGTPVNARDGKGRTALQLAVKACTDSYWKERRRPEWIEVLLEAGASTEGIEMPTGYPEGDILLKKFGVL